MASVGNALEGRKLDLTAAKVLKFGLLKMRNVASVCDDLVLREAGLRVTVFGRRPVPAGRSQGGWSTPGWLQATLGIFYWSRTARAGATISESRRRTCGIAGAYAARRELSKSVEFLDFGQILT